VDSYGNVYVTGGIEVSTGHDYGTIKYDSDGDEEWDETYDSPEHYTEVAYAITVDIDDNVWVTGGHWECYIDSDIYTVKYDSDYGTVLWQDWYDGPAEDDSTDGGLGIHVDKVGNDYNVYVAGLSVGTDTDADYVTLKYSTARSPGPGP
jgi:hypothetical protein